MFKDDHKLDFEIKKIIVVHEHLKNRLTRKAKEIEKI